MNRPLRALLIAAAAAAGICQIGAGVARAATATPPKPIETPMFAARVVAGELPPVAARLPEAPMVVDMAAEGRQFGRQGGTMRTIFGRDKDIRLMVVYGYARLVVYGPDYEIYPDILESFEEEDGRRFTLHLRKGHKWSDGHKFTAEDFRYFWEDVANDPALYPVGPPRELVVDGEKARFEVIDETTVRFSWSNPNPYFLPALAGARPLYIYRPSHYLKKFHEKYAKPDKLAEMVKESGRRNWAALHNRRDNMYNNDNPKLPTLQPWMNTTKPPSKKFEFVRNPFYHRMDSQGRQLPYLDQVSVYISDSKIIPLKTGAGETDLQARGISFSNYTFLKEAEKREDQKVHLWRTAKGAHLALFPNLNARDEEWRALFRDVRFRRALSLAINRHEINQVVYFGLAIEGNNTVLPKSPLFRKEYQTAWTAFDLKRANALLDEIGLTERNSDGVRLLPSGRPMEITVETAGEDSEQTDVLELIRDSWLAAGIKIYSRPSQREVFRNRVFSGETLMSVWSGLENGLPTADTAPVELAPTDQQQLMWPKWGQYYQTKGQSGEPANMPAAQELMALNDKWVGASTKKERREIWHRMLQIHADNMFSIGLISGVFQPVVVSNHLRNVPADGIYNWDPGAHFGIYRPDTFWMDDAGAAPSKSASGE